MANTTICETCKFYVEATDSKGLCVRYPPVVNVVPTEGGFDSEAVTRWPEVAKTDYCGEWVKK
jgi:hypothetical protein